MRRSFVALFALVSACVSSTTPALCDGGCTGAAECVYPLINGAPAYTSNGECATACAADGGNAPVCPTGQSCQSSVLAAPCSGDPCIASQVTVCL